MGKAKRGLLIAGTVMTIVVCLIAVLAALFVMWFGSQFTEEALVRLFTSQPDMYEYQTNVYGYPYVILDLQTGEYMLPETIAMAAELFQLVFKVLGFVVLAFAGIKLLLAIIALAKCGKKFAKGAVITLVVFSFLTFSWLEAGLLIGALAAKGKKVENIEQKNEPMPEIIA